MNKADERIKEIEEEISYKLSHGWFKSEVGSLRAD